MVFSTVCIELSVRGLSKLLDSPLLSGFVHEQDHAHTAHVSPESSLAMFATVRSL